MSTDRRQRILLIAVIAVVGLFAGDRFVIGPLARLWQNWGQRIETVGADVAKFSPKRAQDMQDRWATMKKGSLPTQLPVAESRVLGAVSKWAGRGLTVTSVKPHWLGDDREALARTVEFRVTANGSLDAIRSFLYALETDPMPLRVEDIEVTTRDPKGAALTLSMRFTGLVVLEEKKS